MSELELLKQKLLQKIDLLKSEKETLTNNLNTVEEKLDNSQKLVVSKTKVIEAEQKQNCILTRKMEALEKSNNMLTTELQAMNLRFDEKVQSVEDFKIRMLSLYNTL